MCVCLGTNTWAKIQQWHVLFSFLEGFLWAEIKQMWDSGFEDYIDDWWNLMDFIMNSLYLATISLKIVAYIKVIYIKGFYLSVCFIYYFVLEQPSCRKNWHCVLSILSMFDYCSFFFNSIVQSASWETPGKRGTQHWWQRHCFPSPTFSAPCVSSVFSLPTPIWGLYRFHWAACFWTYLNFSSSTV